MDESQTFWKSKVNRERDETESLVPSVSRPRREHDETLTNFSIFCDETRPETSGKINKRTSPRTRLERDRDETESLSAFSLENETRPRLSPISVMLFLYIFWGRLSLTTKIRLTSIIWLSSIFKRIWSFSILKEIEVVFQFQKN